MFYSRNAPSASTSTDTTQNTNNTDIQQPTADLGDGWYEIENVTNRRMIAGKPHFLVHWKDKTKSYEPEDNVSDHAKAEYYIRCQRRRKTNRRSR